MIKKLILKNFQIHKNLEIDFTPGVNFIVGESAKGKSAIIRALFLLFENSPRAAEKYFHRKGAKNPMEILIEDFKGNVIERRNKKYYLNNVEYKAFKNEVPQPIKELLPFKTINWQMQFDVPFLIFESSGNAAKFLTRITGLEEQTEILAEIKTNISETKSEIKHLTQNLDKEEETIKKLKNIPELKNKLKKVQLFEKQMEELEDEYEELELLVSKIKKSKVRKINFDGIQKQIEKCLSLVSEYAALEQQIDSLHDLVIELKSLDKVPSLSKIELFISKIDKILLDANKYKENDQNIISLQTLLDKYESLSNEKNKLVEQEKEQQKIIKETMKELGICPLCERSF